MRPIQLVLKRIPGPKAFTDLFLNPRTLILLKNSPMASGDTGKQQKRKAEGNPRLEGTALTIASYSTEVLEMNKKLQEMFAYRPVGEEAYIFQDYTKILEKLGIRFNSGLLLSPAAEIDTSPVAPIDTSPLNPNFALQFREFILHREPEEKEVLPESTEIPTSAGDSQISRIITDIYKDHSLFTKVEPWEFEEIMAELLRSQGYQVELTKRTKDGGYDIIALRSLAGNIPFKSLVECKRYKNKVGVGIIRSFKDVVMTNNANMGIIATTGLFTAGAWKKKEQTPYLLDFRDKDAIVAWVKDYVANRNGTL